MSSDNMGREHEADQGKGGWFRRGRRSNAEPSNPVPNSSPELSSESGLTEGNEGFGGPASADLSDVNPGVNSPLEPVDNNVAGNEGEPPETPEAPSSRLKATEIARSDGPVPEILVEGKKPDYAIVLKYRDEILIPNARGTMMERATEEAKFVHSSQMTYSSYYNLRNEVLYLSGVEKEDLAFVYTDADPGYYMGYYYGKTDDTRGIGDCLIYSNPPENSDPDLPDEFAKEVAKYRKIAHERQNRDARILLMPEDDVYVYADRDALYIEKNGDKIIVDDSPAISNICQDPKDKNMLYYYDNYRKTLNSFDVSKEGADLHPVSTSVGKDYKLMKKLRMDPTGKFFLFESDDDFVIASKDSFEEIHRFENFFGANVDRGGKIRGIDINGYLVIYDTNLQEVALELAREKDRVRLERASQLSDGLFEPHMDTKIDSGVEVREFQELIPTKQGFETRFDEQMQEIISLENMSTINDALARLRTRLGSEGFNNQEIDFLTQGIRGSISIKERQLAEPVIAKGLEALTEKLSGELTFAGIGEAKSYLAELRSLEGFADDDTRARIGTLEDKLRGQASEIYRTQGNLIVGNARDIVQGERNLVSQMDNRHTFGDWAEHDYHQQLGRINTMIADYPSDAPQEPVNELIALSRQLRALKAEYEPRFAQEYTEIRQSASKILGERIGLVKADISSLINGLKVRGFRNRSQAETYIRSGDSYAAISIEIEQLAEQDPDAARELRRELDVRLANSFYAVERGESTTIAATGQQMERFGDTLFPIWEGEIHEATRRQFSLVFITDKKTIGSGGEIKGDIGIREVNSRGIVEDSRLYERMGDEDKYRFGLAMSRSGNFLPESYVTQSEFKNIIKDYADWNKGESSQIRQEFNSRVEQIRTLRKSKPEDKSNPGYEDWERQYKGSLGEYAEFTAKKHILIFNRLDNLKKAPETTYANGKGAVEEWQSNWSRDNTTDKYLEEMAQILKMQLDQQSGILGLRGYQGTGKDVLVSMFSNLTNRPYFTVDCSKWDTAYEFSEDIVLDSKDGGTQTVHVPSPVLNAITTPGAILYLNELHALTEPVQIFIHALADAKRRITLKTDSGRVVKALDSVVIAASMNPQERDAIEPALRDRIVFMDIDYPPLYREKDPNDPNPNPPIDSSEALRIAREVDSLSDLTIEPNMDRNEFVRMWDRYVNGIDNGASMPSQIQEFDVNVILALVQFTNRLRENFVTYKSRSTRVARDALPVSLPASGRPLRDCAYGLGDIPSEQKATGDPETVAKSLLGRWFLSKIDDMENREKIRTAMEGWTSSKRVAA
jgi:hypothetical protein